MPAVAPPHGFQSISSRYGFTLIELSIVLVILGLIVGGIVGGRTLIRQAELQAVNREQNGFKTAVNAFKLQYDALPGDFGEATQYWSGTEDGNANGIIYTDDGVNEFVRAWQHLSLSEILSSQYSGALISGDYILGRNVPKSKSPDAGWNMYTADGTPFYGVEDKLFLAIFGGDGNTLDLSGATGVLTPAHAQNFDKKYDDGEADSGKIMFGNFADGTCVANRFWSNSTAGTVQLSSTTRDCILVFEME